MEPAEPATAPLPIWPTDPLKELTASARGWHTIQMAVLGFTGLCGVLRTAGSPAPRAIQVLAAALAVIAVAAAFLAIFLVGQIAYPVSARTSGPGAGQDFARARARLKTGIRMTVAALLIAAIAGLSGWWPALTPATAASAVAPISTTSQAWCGMPAIRPANLAIQDADLGITVSSSAAVSHVVLTKRLDLAVGYPFTGCRELASGDGGEWWEPGFAGKMLENAGNSRLVTP
jgi:hypothetical protein